MAFLSIKSEVGQATKALSAAQQKQLPFAMAKAVNELAFRIQKAERAAMSQVFAHPRPFTQRSVLVEKGTKTSVTARVFVRPEAARYLDPYEVGGRHSAPGAGKGILYPEAIRVDAYGQVRGRPSVIAKRPNVFLDRVSTKTGQVWGIWQRLKPSGTGPRLRMLIGAGDPLEVHKKLGFQDRARAVVAEQARAVFGAALAKALASAR